MNKTSVHADSLCPFCRKDNLAKAFLKTPYFSAIYNIAPVVPGHSLVIPNNHTRSLFDLTEQELGEMMVFARRVTSVLKTVFGCDGFDWSIQDGESAGQTIPHLHLHIIPRKPSDIPVSEEWYSKLSDNNNKMLDSQQRERLGEVEYDAITDKLTLASARFMQEEKPNP
ncbi:MAG: HIT family protein [Bacteroidota bacterium]